MGHCQLISDSSDFKQVALSRFDAVIEWLLVILLAFMPMAFGVVHAWSREIVIILSAVIAFCFLLKLIYNRQMGIVRTYVYVPVVTFLIIVLFQLVPSPVTFVNAISPNTVAVKRELLGDLPNADTLLKSLTITFYSYATKHDLRLVLSIATIFIVVLNVFRRSEQIKRLLRVIAVIGGIVAMITIAQNLFGNGKIYWFIPTRYGNGYSGPFVNHSNYGQFMNLSIGAALAYLFVKIHEDFAHKQISPANMLNYFSSGSARIFWLLVVIISLGMATVFITLTRGGIISMLAALIFTTINLSLRRSLKGHGWVMVVAALAAFTCVLYTGFDAVYQRLASLRDFHEAQSGRLQILKDIFVMSTKFPLFGTGLGTHYVVYPMFDRSTIPALAAHAENEYAQVLEETGLAGLCVLATFGFIIWSSYAKCVRKGASPISSAVYGLGFGLLAILIHSLSDFGQHLPCNAFLSAIFCALTITLSQQVQSQKYVFAGRLRTLSIGIFLVVSVLMIWAGIGSNRSRMAEVQWTKADKIAKALSIKNWQGTEPEYGNLISLASMAVKYDPENIEYQYWLNVYRWHSIPRKTDPDTRQAVLSEGSMPLVRDIAEQLHAVRKICPTYGPVYSVAGQIEKIVLNDDRGAEDIRKGFRLAPCDPIACFMAGYLDVLEGKTNECFSKFARAFELDTELFRAVADMYIYQLNRPELAFKAAGDEIWRLNYVADAFMDMQYNDLADLTIKKIKDLLEVQCAGNQVSGSVFEALARIYVRQNKNYTAIACYRRALSIDYSQIHWRLDLAKLLAQSQQIPEAIHEIKVCLRLRPGLKEAEQLLEQLCVNPAGFSKDVTSQ